MPVEEEQRIALDSLRNGDREGLLRHVMRLVHGGESGIRAVVAMIPEATGYDLALMVAALGGRPSEVSRPALSSLLLDSQDASVRSAAAVGLARLGGPDAEAALLQASRAESDWATAGTIFEALRALGTPGAVAELERVARDRAAPLLRRLGALSARGMVPGARTRPFLEQILDESLAGGDENLVACKALDALGWLGDPASLPLAQRVLDSTTSPMVRSAATRCVESIRERTQSRASQETADRR